MGLEECVTKILGEDKENTEHPHPFSCSQCGSDFTPTWKWDKASKGNYLKKNLSNQTQCDVTI